MKDICEIEKDKFGTTLVHLNNCVEYVTAKDLANMFSVSKTSISSKLRDLQKSYEIKTFPWGEKILLINLQDFRRALFDSLPTNLKK